MGCLMRASVTLTAVERQTEPCFGLFFGFASTRLRQRRCQMSAAIINSAGLFLDIVGIILLFFFGMPSRVNEGPPVLSFGEDLDSTKQREKQWKQYQLVSRFALVLLILGFALQIVSNHTGFIELVLMR